MSVAGGLASVRARIERACVRAAREPSEIRLVAVSKKQPPALLREAHALGVRDFGESYVQELVVKAQELAGLDGIRWHLVGHLQTNKARDVARVAAVVHSVDSARVARELARRAPPDRDPVEVLVQVNVGGEAQKSGCAPAAIAEVLAAIEAEPALRLRGLMTVPPHTDDPAGARPHLRRLRELRDQHGGSARLPELSMGMTHDLEIAVEEGATLVRVGTAIFGERT